jgi:hypothetical protein
MKIEGKGCHLISLTECTKPQPHKHSFSSLGFAPEFAKPNKHIATNMINKCTTRAYTERMATKGLLLHKMDSIEEMLHNFNTQ